MIEINDDFIAQVDESALHLKNAGFLLYGKYDLGGGNQYNQWWVRGNSTFKWILVNMSFYPIVKAP